MSTDPIALARTALSASTQTDDAEIATFYLGSARLALTRARTELAEIERVLVARERELARVAAPKQLTMETKP